MSIPKSNDGNFNTGDTELDLLLGLTEDMGAGNCNMDTGMLWMSALEAIKKRLSGLPPIETAASKDAIEAARDLETWARQHILGR